jgi:hypothetical protein
MERAIRRTAVAFVAAVLSAAVGAPAERALAEAIAVEDYGLYDQIVEKKFLTSDIQLVVIERMTVPRLLPDQDGPITIKFFQEQGFFGGELPPDLVQDFVGANQKPARLEGRFRFGPRYRFVSGNALEEPEVRRAVPSSAMPPELVQYGPVLDRLAFSRVGRTFRNDQALVYVENPRPDGTGAGFLVWFRRQASGWTIFDTEVVWTVRSQEEGGEGPLLAL